MMLYQNNRRVKDYLELRVYQRKWAAYKKNAFYAPIKSVVETEFYRTYTIKTKAWRIRVPDCLIRKMHNG